jgi:hypothetical protein
LFLYPLEKVVNNFLELTNQTKPTEKFWETHQRLNRYSRKC